MAHEYSIRFEDGRWYSAHRQAISAYLDTLPHLVRRGTPEEVWLKDRTVNNPWDYDVRLFLKPEFIAVEVSVTTSSFRQDVAQLVNWLRSQTRIELVDDDRIPFEF